MKYQIIFTIGNEYMDEWEALEKEVRGDVLILNEQNEYFQPIFITIERLAGEFIGSKEICYFEEFMVVLPNVGKEAILQSIPIFCKQEFTKYHSPLSREILEKYFFPKEKWVTFDIEVE